MKTGLEQSQADLAVCKTNRQLSADGLVASKEALERSIVALMQRTFPGMPIAPPIKTKKKRNNTKVRKQEPGLFGNEIPPTKHRKSKTAGELKNKTKERKRAERVYERCMVAYKHSETAWHKKREELQQNENDVLHSRSERERIEIELLQRIEALKGSKDQTSALQNIRLMFEGREEWEQKKSKEEKNTEKKEWNEKAIVIRIMDFREKKSALEKSITERKNKLDEEWELIEKVAQEQNTERMLIDELKKEQRETRNAIESVKQRIETQKHEIAKIEWQESEERCDASAEALLKSIVALEKSIEGLKDAKNEWKQSNSKWQVDKSNFDKSENADFPNGKGGRI